MFKINDLNREQFDTASTANSLLGIAFHKAAETYLGNNQDHVITSEEEAIIAGNKVGLDFIEQTNEGFIKFTDKIKTKEQMKERFVFVFNEFIATRPYTKAKEIILIEEKIKEFIDVKHNGKQLSLPIALSGRIDVVFREDGKLKIKDYKTTFAFKKKDEIDGEKIIQAVIYYLLVYAYTGEKPYSILFEEYKYTQNQQKKGAPKESQVRTIEFVYEEYDIYFDFFFRLYEDIIKALMGEQVFVPNLQTFFDKEVAIIAYAHRLDENEVVARELKKTKVENITQLLTKKLQKHKNLKQLAKYIEKEFVSSSGVSFKDMKEEQKIQEKLIQHGIMLHFHSKIEGNTVDLYQYEPSVGLKMSKIQQYAADVEQILGKSGVRVLAPIPDTTLVGFEVPRKDRTFVDLPEKTKGFDLHMGVDILGKNITYDLRKAPHLLVAGTTGSGKSVFINGLIIQLNRIKSDVELYLYDPKAVEFTMFEDERNVVEYQSDPIAIQKSLKNIADVMDERYKVLAKAKVRKVEDYTGKMPYMFLVVDEFADLAMQTRDGFIDRRYCEDHAPRAKTLDYLFSTKKKLQKHEIEMIESVASCVDCESHIYPPLMETLMRLAQKGRACGIHLILATQRPSTDVITGTVKANFPVKAVFKTAKAIDSQIVLDKNGAEQLQGQGDMLFVTQDKETRLQAFNC